MMDAPETDSSEPQERPLFLKELIAKVEDDLRASQVDREARGHPPMFEVADLSLEVHFVIERTGEASGGVDLKVLTVGGRRNVRHEQVHKVTLKLVGVPYGTEHEHAREVMLDSTLPTFRPSED